MEPRKSETVEESPVKTSRLEFGLFRVTLAYTRADLTPDYLEFVTQSGDEVRVVPPLSNPDLIEQIFDELTECTYIKP